MSINNSPTIGPYTKLEPFRFWCQKVLPLTYDESLSYYELLCKVIDYLNKAMEDVDTMAEDMEKFKEAYDELISYVNNYFDNLDVQNEINHKIDKMAEDGYFTDLFNTLFRADVITEAGNVVSAWIDENLSQEDGYVIDKSLTVEDAAADAKATGDRILPIGSQTINLTDDFPFEIGIITSAGDKQSGNNRIRSVHPFYTDMPMKMILTRQEEATTNVRVRALYYDAPIINHNHFLFLDDWIVTTEVGVPVSADIKQGYWVMLLGGYGGTTPCEPLADIVSSYEIRAYAPNFVKGDLAGKTIAIIGDSISTNGNTGPESNAVEIKIEEEDVGVELSAYLTYYDVAAGLTLGNHTFTSEEIGTEVTFTPIADDVGKVIGLPHNYNTNATYTWWENVKNKLNCNFIPVCWSGASISDHESSEAELKTAHSFHPAQIRKCGIRTPGTMTRTAPDAIIVFRGINDFSHTPYTRINETFFDNYDWEYPATDLDGTHYEIKAAYSILIKELRAAYPNAEIILCTLPTFKRVNYSHFPVNNGINSLPQFNKAIRECADFFGCKLIEFDKDGVTFENCYAGGYITDSSVTPTHPNDKGHYIMSKRAVKDLLNTNTLIS